MPVSFFEANLVRTEGSGVIVCDALDGTELRNGVSCSYTVVAEPILQVITR
jgi:hypothetical protein